MNEPILSDDPPSVKIFASDDNLKTLGELLSNDSSRKIISNLMTQEMYTNEISTKLDMRVSLVIHHLKKLEELNMLEITEKKIKRKGVKHRFFKINSNIFVTVNQNKAEIEEKGFLKRIFKEGIKFGSIVLASVISWFTVNFQSNSIETWTSSSEYQIPDEYVHLSVVVSLCVMIIGLIVKNIYEYFKKKNGGG